MAGENPYPWNGTDLRWEQGNPTDETRLNIARIHLDHLYTALSSAFNTAYSGLVGLYNNALKLGGASGGRIWWDASNSCWRTKSGSDPSSETDGDHLSTLSAAIVQHPSTIGEDTTVPDGYNAVSAGPITVAVGTTVTLEPVSVWTIV